MRNYSFFIVVKNSLEKHVHQKKQKTARINKDKASILWNLWYKKEANW